MVLEVAEATLGAPSASGLGRVLVTGLPEGIRYSWEDGRNTLREIGQPPG